MEYHRVVRYFPTTAGCCLYVPLTVKNFPIAATLSFLRAFLGPVFLCPHSLLLRILLFGNFPSGVSAIFLLSLFPLPCVFLSFTYLIFCFFYDFFLFPLTYLYITCFELHAVPRLLLGSLAQPKPSFIPQPHLSPVLRSVCYSFQGSVSSSLCHLVFCRSLIFSGLFVLYPDPFLLLPFCRHPSHHSCFCLRASVLVFSSSCTILCSLHPDPPPLSPPSPSVPLIEHPVGLVHPTPVTVAPSRPLRRRHLAKERSRVVPADRELQGLWTYSCEPTVTQVRPLCH